MSDHVHIGGHVIYIDTTGKERPALITNVFGPADQRPAVNVVFVNDDENQTDNYGRKTERASSVVHQSWQYAFGNKWRHVNEKREEPKTTTTSES